MNQTIARLALCAMWIVEGLSFSSHAEMKATPHITLNVTSDITVGTCTATLRDSGNSIISEVAFGDVYTSELGNKVKTFKLQFTDCVGVPGRKANITLLPKGIGCAGTTGNSPDFANGFIPSLEQDIAAANVAVEVWTTNTPQSGGSVQFNCANRNTQQVNISTASGTATVDYPLSARLVVTPGKQRTQVVAGQFKSPATFNITYE
ncbi:fimbrial protein [Kluyvera sp. STS39-E]|uniref:fimbrial protein n=1 Tax=Kluyvera sp. STS39-E TaxID=3234748 RepID=UPI0034C6CFD0